MKRPQIIPTEPPSLSVPEQDFREQRHDRISARAYEIYEARGGAWGQDLDDWLQAEIQIDEEMGGADKDD